MNKKMLFTIALGFTGIGIIVAANIRQFNNQKEQAGEDLFQANIKHLVETGQYDSATRYAGNLRKMDSISYDDLEMALATIAWTKGDKATAYQYFVNNTDYLLKTYAGDHAFTPMLYNYEYAYGLATDTFLEKIITDKVSNFYSDLHDFPLATSGLKFILADYKLAKLKARRTYVVKHQSQYGNSVAQTLAALKEEEEELIQNFLDELGKNGKLLTWKEAGAAYQTQYNFIISKNDSTLHALVQPYFDKAYRDGELDPRIYVDKLVWMAALHETDNQKLDKLHDSLCTVYKCMQVRRVYILKNGDSAVVYDENRFGSPKPTK